MSELTKQQIDRQDFVDNAIYNLVNELVPFDFKLATGVLIDTLVWDGEWIASLREQIFYILAENLEGCRSPNALDLLGPNGRENFDKQAKKYRAFEMAFYPYITDDSEISDL